MKNKIITTLIILALLMVITVVVYMSGSIPIVNKNNSTLENININADVLETPKVSGPAINITPQTYDLGTVVYGDVAKHIFTIKNVGDKPLEILKLATSCGCTKVSVADQDKIILPGESVDMIVTFDPAVHKDDSDLGELSRIIYVTTNDPQNPKVQTEITANVIKSNQ
ncbi:MAG: DUF1573 domain-containing protein [Patescibacteria group bacterium]